MKQIIIILTAMASLFSPKDPEKLATVEQVDINRYSGTWYEIARLPNSFEKDMKCVTATYSLKENGKIRVLNQGFVPGSPGKWKKARGTAWVPDKAFPGRLKVSFFWPFAGNYYILVLDEDYQYALVGDPTRKYLWVLARNNRLDDAIYSQLMNQAKKDGFDILQVELIEQDCD